MKTGAYLCGVVAFGLLFAQPAPCRRKVKLGVQGAHSGDLASYGVPSLNAVKIVVDDINARGGILGEAVEVIAQDDQCKPEMGTSAATKLISDKVAAVVALFVPAPQLLPAAFGNAETITVSQRPPRRNRLKMANIRFFRTVAK